MADTVFKVENGLEVVGNANVVGSLTVGGEFNISGNVTFSGTSNGDFKPINNNYSLGDADQRWALSATTLDVNGTTTLGNTLSVAGQSTFSANVIPNANNIRLGDTTKRWDFYANNANVLTFGVNIGTAANLIISNTATVNGTLIVNPGVANAIVITGNSTHSNITFNSNSTQFFSNVIFDTNVLFVDAFNNRVGIVNSTPDAALTISGTANVSGGVVLGSTLAVNNALTVSNNGIFTGTVNASAGFNAGANVLLSTSDIKVGNATVNSFINSSSFSTTGTLSVAANASFSNNVTISGNLTVSGTTTYVNTATLNVADNIVTLNADVGGATAPTENAGIEVNRGSSANVTVRWNEASDVWDLTENGTNFYQVVSRNQTANATYAGIVAIIDSVSNTSAIIAASANSVKTAYDIASTAYSNAVVFSANADNITSGTLTTARLPATANISTLVNVGANVNLSTTSIKVGNATVNTFVNSSSISTTGTLSVTSNASFGANVTINTGNLAVNGDITATGTIAASSDARVKTNIRPIPNPLDTVMNIDGVLYDRVDNDVRNQIGFIAQQLIPHIPQVVNGSEEAGYVVQYQNMTALLVEAIKELNNKVDKLSK